MTVKFYQQQQQNNWLSRFINKQTNDCQGLSTRTKQLTLNKKTIACLLFEFAGDAAVLFQYVNTAGVHIVVKLGGADGNYMVLICERM